MSKTISQILSEYGGFEKAFWATYSISFTTLEFLLKKDFKHVMPQGYLHVICDGSQLDESIAKTYDERKNLLSLAKLQEYCTIVPQFANGAFHPKILAFTSPEKLLFIVSSANATPSGILSNQDLIGIYYYDRDYVENQKTVYALFQYIRGFDGWGIEAKEDFNIVANDHSFLQETLSTDSVLTIPNTESLFTQIIKELPSKDNVKEVNVFSPFFDDNYEAVSAIENQFNTTLNIFSPQKEFNTARKEKLSGNTRFFRSDTLLNRSFHAKFYEFKYESESVVFWGSANCSFSGLLSSSRNYEVLLKSHMSHTEVQSIWGSLESKEESAVEYECQFEDVDKHKSKPRIYITKVLTNDQFYIVHLDKEITTETFVGIFSNGASMELSIQKVDGEGVAIGRDQEGLISIYVANEQKRVSNLIYINNPFAIASRIAGIQENPNPEPKDAIESQAVTSAFGYFNLDLPKKTSVNKSSPLSLRGFWRLSQFKSRSTFSKVINLEYFLNNRIIRYKEKDDDENVPEHQKGRKITPNSKDNILKKIITETNTVLKNIKLLVSEKNEGETDQYKWILVHKKKKEGEIDPYKWIEGINRVNIFVLNFFDEIQEFPRDLKEIGTVLHNISIISSWITKNFIETNEEYRNCIELMRTIQDLFLGIFIYKMLLIQTYSYSYKQSDEELEQAAMIKRAFFLRHIVNKKMSLFGETSEHSRLTYKDVLYKLHNPKIRSATIEILNRGDIAKIKELGDVCVYENQEDSFLFARKSDYLYCETLLGENKMLGLNHSSYNKRNLSF